uniref:Uncharacterized protein n=1 Tax=Polytomella parva TaxID=51329 RepID=A0A7S0UNC7_9CHLO
MTHLLEHVVEIPMKEFPLGIVDSDVENGVEMKEGEEEEEKEENVEEKEGESTEEEEGYVQDDREERGDGEREQIIVQKSVNKRRKGANNKRENDEEEEMQCFLNNGKPVEEEKIMERNEESEMEMSQEKEKGNSDADDINIVKEDLKKTSRATYREVMRSITSKRVTEVEETPLSTRGPITSTSSVDSLLPCTVPATVPSPPPLEKIQLVLVGAETESVQDKRMKGDDVGGDEATNESHGRKGKGSRGSKRIVASQRKSSKKAEIGKGEVEKGGIAPDSTTALPPSLSLLSYSSRADAPPAPSSPPPSPPPPPPPAFFKPVNSIRVPSVLPTAMINTTNTTGAFMKPPPTLSTPVNAIVDGFGRSGGIKIPSPSTSFSTISSFSSQRFSTSSSLSVRPPPSSSSSLGRLQLPNGMQLPKVQISLNPLVLQAAKLRRQFVSPLTVASMQPIHRPQNTGENDSVKKSGIKRKASSLFATKSSYPRLG